MASITDIKEKLKKEIRELYAQLANDHQFIFSENVDKNKLTLFSDTAAQLAKKIEAYSQLISIDEEKPKIEISEPVVIIPNPEPVTAKEEIVIPNVVQVEKPVEQKTERENIVSTSSSKKFPDIKTMIGFNERLMFLKHLFNSDAGAYESAVAQLNSCNSLEEANAFLSVVSDEYKWNKDSEPVFIFNSIVKRRFA